MMSNSKHCLGLSVDFRAVTSSSVFPDLCPIETSEILTSQRRVKLVLAMFGASCRRFMSSLPQIDLLVIAAMVLLAIA